MAEQPNASENPLPHPWANRRMRGTEVPRRTSHPWATRGPRNVEQSHRVPNLLSAPRVAEGGPSELFPLPGGSPSAARTRRMTAAPEPVSGPMVEVEVEVEEPGSGRNGRSRPSVRRLGAGLVLMPRVSPVDPRTAILDDPEVPELKRFCWKCQEPVGRRTAAGPGAVVGECGRCRSPFNFRPTLQHGELVADQYEVKGSLAHGGLGWIYLAIDHNVSDRWVVLKGLQNPLDFEAHVVALAERQFLSEVAHPGVVKIYNFVKHRSARDIADGYIVMEYVGGQSLKKVLDLRTPDRIPVVEAIAYIMEILPAFDYLHSLGLAYNDLKPDNIMVSEHEVKLIDLGAVAAMDSYGSIYGTPGYQAPEITETGPTMASDIYTVGRTLAALALDLPKDRDGHILGGIPEPEDEPLFARYPCLHRLLLRATDPEPERRFPSAYSMYCQLAGALRMVLAIDTGLEHPQQSVEFGSMRDDFGIDTLIGQTDGIVDGMARMPVLEASDVVAALPTPLIDSEDPSAELLSTLLHGEPRHALDALRRAHERIRAGTIAAPESFALEGPLTGVRAYLDLGETVPACQLLVDLRPEYGTDWRIEWYVGVAALIDGYYEQAWEHFETVHSMLPGEIGPELALAATAELVLQQLDNPAESDRWHRAASEHYRAVWRTNHGVVSAAFGLARRLAAAGELLEAVAALDQVPAASRHYGVAHTTGCLLLVSRQISDITEADICAAADRLESMPEDSRTLQLQVIVVGAALEWLRVGGSPRSSNRTILGFPVTSAGLRKGLESSLRALAKVAPDRWHRYRLVDLSNHIRLRTRW